MKIDWLIAPGVLLAAAATPAHAVQYYTAEQVQRALFPAATGFTPRSLLLTAAQRDAIAAAAEVKVPSAQLQVWEASGPQGALGFVLIDAVIGKHEAITYAVAMSAAGKVQGVEIMDYRETYGGQIRDERWRAQFTGKGSGDALRVDADIRNVSGATLSCTHVTDGIRRLVVTFDQVVKGRG